MLSSLNGVSYVKSSLQCEEGFVCTHLLSSDRFAEHNEATLVRLNGTTIFLKGPETRGAHENTCSESCERPQQIAVSCTIVGAPASVHAASHSSGNFTHNDLN